eukprot:15048285-Alexandrium_andersonii.AAC.1
MVTTPRLKTSATSSRDWKRKYASRAGRTADHHPWGRASTRKARRISSKVVSAAAPRIRSVS